MSLYKRGKVYWMEFVYDGQQIRRSTGMPNRRHAEQIEAAYKTQLARGEVGIEERKVAPSLRVFAQQFADHIPVRHMEKPQTMRFYSDKLKQLLKYELLREIRIDRIDESLVERMCSYVFWRRSQGVSPTTVNRELATLRRILHIAEEWKLVARVPRIGLLAGER